MLKVIFISDFLFNDCDWKKKAILLSWSLNVYIFSIATGGRKDEDFTRQDSDTILAFLCQVSLISLQVRTHRRLLIATSRERNRVQAVNSLWKISYKIEFNCFISLILSFPSHQPLKTSGTSSFGSCQKQRPLYVLAWLPRMTEWGYG